MLTKVFPAALALAVAIGVLTELAITRSKVYTVADALTESETAIVNLKGQVTPTGRNTYIFEDRTGRIELQMCPTWYRRINLREHETITVTGEIIRQSGLSRHTIYTYITMGLIKPTQTTPTGQNLFGNEVIKRLGLIHSLNESGYTLRDLKEIFFRNR